MEATTTHDRPAGGVQRKLALRALIGAAIATVAALGLLVLATASDQPLEVQAGSRPPQDVAAGAIVSVTLMSGAAAWATAASATRLARHPRAVFLAAAVLALALSLVPPATAANGATTWWLEAMHVAVFTALVAAMAPAIPSRSTTRSARREPQALGGAA